ncbi:hypothetical protein ACOZ4N_07170 [Halorientalis pallida]|uniref:hypothetical protein n=1 Tax=Halorientalis pallida TaxID=2479928 RepID=UPI003C700A2C
MILVGLVGGVVAAVLLVGPALYASTRTTVIDEAVDFPVAVAIALVGVFVGGLTDVLLGWIPVLGRFFSPFAWALVVRYTVDERWPVALLLGAVSWALTAGFFALV